MLGEFLVPGLLAIFRLLFPQISCDWLVTSMSVSIGNHRSDSHFSHNLLLQTCVNIYRCFIELHKMSTDDGYFAQLNRTGVKPALWKISTFVLIELYSTIQLTQTSYYFFSQLPSLVARQNYQITNTGKKSTIHKLMKFLDSPSAIASKLLRCRK